MSFFENLAFIKANTAFNARNYDKALEIYKKACSKKKAGNGIKLSYASTLIYLGKADTCKEVLDNIDYASLSEDRFKITYRETEGRYLWKIGKIDEAIDTYKNLLNDFKTTSIYETLGYLLIVGKRYEEALELNLEAKDYDSNNVILDNLAQSYYYLNQKEEAFKIYQNIIDEAEKKPNFSEPYYYYGLLLKENGNVDEANNCFEKALTFNESNLSIISHEMIKAQIQK
ncbi:MAG: tetratricopeptide repeat protein [Clostridium sp.]|nr:tetratricopeptide repeat protein [Clostridium sp.]